MAIDLPVQQFLNDAILREAHVALTYSRMAAVAERWGYDKYAAAIMKAAQDEMHHLDAFTDSLLQHDGQLDEVLNLPTIAIGDSLPTQLAIVKGLEQEAIDLYNSAITACAQAADNDNRALFEQVLASEWGHWKYADENLVQIAQYGLDNWLPAQV